MDTTRKPSWLRAKVPGGPGYQAVRQLVDANRLHTVCQSAKCPNLGECWARGTATLMILGNICTRSCNFCAIETGRPTKLDLGEPARVAEAVATMGLRHCVLTSVARDELADGGASVWAATIRAVRHRIIHRADIGAQEVDAVLVVHNTRTLLGDSTFDPKLWVDAAAVIAAR